MSEGKIVRIIDSTPVILPHDCELEDLVRNIEICDPLLMKAGSKITVIIRIETPTGESNASSK